MAIMREMMLVNGEKVLVNFTIFFDLELTFARIHKELILGIANNERHHGFYLFQKVKGIYQPVGEGSFWKYEDMVKWVIEIYQKPELEPELGPDRNEFLRAHASGILSTPRESVLNTSKQPLPV